MDFNQFFAQFNSIESYRILAFLLVAFLLGLWVGRLTRRPRILRLERELEEKKKELAGLQSETGPLREELDLKKADLKKFAFEKEELEAKVQRLEADKAKMYREVHAINTELEQSKTVAREQLDKLVQIQAELEEQRQKNEALSAAASEKEDTVVDNVAQMQSVYNATRSRLEALEERMTRLDEENQTLKQEVAALKEQPALLSRAAGAAPVAAPAPEEEAEPALEISFTRERAVMGQKIFLDEEQPKDDLTCIQVIGPFLQKQLNDIGIFTYRQISEFDAATIEEVTKAIGYFPGRIEKDDWVGQARRLYEQSAKIEAGTGEVYFSDEDPKLQDLKIVEGIGPKIESLLKEAGIGDLPALSEAEPERLREILLAASDRYQIHDPTTWPAQARLAVNGDWELLKEYQEQLKGGREVHPDETDE